MPLPTAERRRSQSAQSDVGHVAHHREALAVGALMRARGVIARSQRCRCQDILDGVATVGRLQRCCGDDRCHAAAKEELTG